MAEASSASCHSSYRTAPSAVGMSHCRLAQGRVACAAAAARSASPSLRDTKKEGMRMPAPPPSSAIMGSAHWQPAVA